MSAKLKITFCSDLLGQLVWWWSAKYGTLSINYMPHHCDDQRGFIKNLIYPTDRGKNYLTNETKIDLIGAL